MQPKDIRIDYYSRPGGRGAPLPMMVVEGGWPRAGVGSGPGSIVSWPRA